MNLYDIVAADKCLKATPEEYKTLNGVLHADPNAHHGFKLEYSDGELFLYASELGQVMDFSDAFLEMFGLLITKNDMPYLTFGVASTADRPSPGQIGGTKFRIYADGFLQYARLVWDRDLKDGETKS